MITYPSYLVDIEKGKTTLLFSELFSSFSIDEVKKQISFKINYGVEVAHIQNYTITNFDFFGKFLSKNYFDYMSYDIVSDGSGMPSKTGDIVEFKLEKEDTVYKIAKDTLKDLSYYNYGGTYCDIYLLTSGMKIGEKRRVSFNTVGSDSKCHVPSVIPGENFEPEFYITLLSINGKTIPAEDTSITDKNTITTYPVIRKLIEESFTAKFGTVLKIGDVGLKIKSVTDNRCIMYTDTCDRNIFTLDADMLNYFPDGATNKTMFTLGARDNQLKDSHFYLKDVKPERKIGEVINNNDYVFTFVKETYK